MKNNKPVGKRFPQAYLSRTSPCPPTLNTIQLYHQEDYDDLGGRW